MAVEKVANISSLEKNCVSTKKPNQTCGWGCRGKTQWLHMQLTSKLIYFIFRNLKLQTVDTWFYNIPMKQA